MIAIAGKNILHLSDYLNIIILALLILIAALTDIKTRKIPNQIVIIGIIFSLLIQCFSSHEFLRWGLGMLTGFIIFFPLYLLRAMGAGDVKLMAMIGTFTGPSAIFGIGITTLVAGGVLAVMVATYKRSLRRTVQNVHDMLINTILRSTYGQVKSLNQSPTFSTGDLPYAVAIAVGTVTYLFLESAGFALFI